MKEKRCCRGCSLPVDFPGVTLDARGRCNFCAEFEAKDKAAVERIRQRSREELARLLPSLKGQGKYDCVVALSGGKDSSYLTWLLAREHGLRVLAVTVDTGFINPVALRNIALVTGKFKVDHSFVDATQVFRMIYRYAFKTSFFSTRQGLACSICSRVIPSVVARFAVREHIPVVMSGEFTPDNPVLRKDPGKEEDVAKKVPGPLFSKIKGSGLLYVGPGAGPSRVMPPMVLYPLNTIAYHEKEIVDTLCRELGLKDRDRFCPIRSNCLVALVTMLLYHRKLGYNPYHCDVSNLVRWGCFDRERWHDFGTRAVKVIQGDKKLKSRIAASLKSLDASF